MVPDSTSPSLVPHRIGVAREIKFIIDDARFQAIEPILADRFQLDPHCSKQPHKSYSVDSVYLDTEDRKVLKRFDGYRKHKYRMRRYGKNGPMFAERKTKHHSNVSKQRVSIQKSDLQRFEQAWLNESNEWDGGWFQKEVDRKQLRPACRVTYTRRAYFGLLSGLPVRVTIDSNLLAKLHTEWNHEADNDDAQSDIASLAALPLTDCIFEFKFVEELPLLFKSIIAEFELSVARFSKYRNSMSKLLMQESSVTRRTDVLPISPLKAPCFQRLNNAVDRGTISPSIRFESGCLVR